MAMMFLAAVMMAATIGATIFGGLFDGGAAAADLMQLGTALAISLGVAGAAAFDT